MPNCSTRIELDCINWTFTACGGAQGSDQGDNVREAANHDYSESEHADTPTAASTHERLEYQPPTTHGDPRVLAAA